MSSKKKFLLFVLLSLSLGSLYAQEQWSLEECVTYALDNNLTLKDFEYSKDSGQESYRQSIRNLLPVVNAASDYNISYGRATDPYTNDIVNTEFFSNGYSLNSSIGIFRGLQKLNTIKATKLLYQATHEDLEQQRYLLALRVMTAYLDILFYQGLLEISEEQLTISETNYTYVKRQIELGLKAGADLYEAESILYGDQLNFTQSRDNLAVANLTLVQEMNLQGVDRIQIDPSLPPQPERMVFETDSVYAEALDFLPLLRAQRFRTDAALKELKVTKGGLYPSLSFSAGYGTGYFETTRDSLGVTIPFKTQVKDNASHFIGFNLNLPIFNAWSAKSRIQQQKIELKRAENNLHLQEQEVFKAIQQLVQENNSLKVELVQSEKEVLSQEQAYNIARKKYERGLFSIMDLFLAKSLFATAQNKNLQVKLRLHINRYTLDFYRGLPIFNINTVN